MSSAKAMRDERKKEIVGMIEKDMDLAQSLYTILMPEIGFKPLRTISPKERSSLARRLNLVVESILNIESIEKERYDDNKLTGALLLTAEQASQARARVDEKSSKHEYVM